MTPETAALAGRVLRWTGATLAVAGAAAVLALRHASAEAMATSDPYVAFGRGAVLASFAMLLTLLTAVGMALLVAGLALRIDTGRVGAVLPRPMLRRAADEE